MDGGDKVGKQNRAVLEQNWLKLCSFHFPFVIKIFVNFRIEILEARNFVALKGGWWGLPLVEEELDWFGALFGLVVIHYQPWYGGSWHGNPPRRSDISK